MRCAGPLIWFSIEPDNSWPAAAILECASCDYVVITGGLNDRDHTDTPLLVGS